MYSSCYHIRLSTSETIEHHERPSANSIRTISDFMYSIIYSRSAWTDQFWLFAVLKPSMNVEIIFCFQFNKNNNAPKNLWWASKVPNLFLVNINQLYRHLLFLRTFTARPSPRRGCFCIFCKIQNFIFNFIFNTKIRLKVILVFNVHIQFKINSSFTQHQNEWW